MALCNSTASSSAAMLTVGNRRLEPRDREREAVEVAGAVEEVEEVVAGAEVGETTTIWKNHWTHTIKTQDIEIERLC